MRLVEGLALPDEGIESRLSYYNNATYWVAASPSPPRVRGQLKEPAQLDSWLRDGSAAFVERLCSWRGTAPAL